MELYKKILETIGPLQGRIHKFGANSKEVLGVIHELKIGVSRHLGKLRIELGSLYESPEKDVSKERLQEIEDDINKIQEASEEFFKVIHIARGFFGLHSTS